MSVISVSATSAGLLRGTDHDRDLQTVRALTMAVTQPCPSLIRISVQLPAQAEIAPWLRANIAVRILLGPAFGAITRIYTVHSIDADTRQFLLDVVLHEPPGPMLSWVRTLKPGDSFDLIGPRPHLQVPNRSGSTALLFADPSAVPALHALLQQWPADLHAQVWVASDDPFPVDELPHIPGVHVQRIAMSETCLLRQAQALAPDPTTVVWAAGEREEMRELRRHFIDKVGLARADVAVAGYWKYGESTTQTDQRRRRNYEQVLARGGGLQDVDDLADEI